MNEKCVVKFKKLLLLLLFMGLVLPFSWTAWGADDKPVNVNFADLEKKVQGFMENGKIPGLTLVIVRDGQPDIIKGYGYADVDKKTPVTPDTLFELCSTSKAFTALAALKCEADGLINLDSPVSTYLPWFYTMYKGEKQHITIRQLLHQTSGMPYRAVTRIPPSSAANALEQTVRNLVGIELDFKPGEKFSYATINYDILAAVIQEATGMAYEDYMVKNILRPLGLTHTLAGREQLAGQETSTGYKISFFKPRPFDAPSYRGNNAAGYIITNGTDMARWLKLQLGLEENEFSPLIQKTHERDKSVRPNPANMLAYAMGWMTALDGSGMILHPGNNPNFTAYVIFNPEKKIGVAVMANSNSNFTPYIGGVVMTQLVGLPMPPEIDLGDNIDKSSSVISFVLGLYLIFVLIFFLLVIMEILKGKRRFEPITFKTISRLVGALIALLPFAYGVYLLPYVIGNVNWETVLVWSPTSFKIAAGMIFLVMICSYLAFVFSKLFPQQNKYIRSVPFLVLISLLSGGSNAVVIFLISMSLYTTIQLKYVLFYFTLAGLLYLVGRRVLQSRLVNLSFDIIYDLRMKLIDRLFNTSFQKYEKLDTGRVIAVLNNDTGQLGGTANIFVTILSSIITTLGAFLYLGAIAFWATLVTVGVIIIVAAVYYIVTQKAAKLFNIARNTQNEYLSLLNGLNAGFKELSLHSAKKIAFRRDVEGVTNRFRFTSSDAVVRFVNAFMVGESMLIMVLGAVAFAIPVLLPHIKNSTLMSFIMVLLYLIGPVTSILNAMPQMVQMRIAWQRVQGLLKDMPETTRTVDKPMLPSEVGEVQSIKAQGVFFEYEAKEESEKFAVGPLDFEAKKGEIVFIVGGNGSGKTTLAKLLTGLYIPDKGSITINGKDISSGEVGEYFSVVFGDFHLFEKLYDVDLTGKEEDLKAYLDMLRLKEKVDVKDNAFTTVELSGGQRKRLALLRCYLEDRPIYLFDEVAADQDPEFRKFFYRTLLTKMKEKGKTVIAITHDDHYFDVADRVIKMDMGKIEMIGDKAAFSVTK